MAPYCQSDERCESDYIVDYVQCWIQFVFVIFFHILFSKLNTMAEPVIFDDLSKKACGILD